VFCPNFPSVAGPFLTPGHPGVNFKRVSQDNSWPTERYEMAWQPRALPVTDFGDSIVLEDPVKSETRNLLETLDRLAEKYITRTLK